MLKVATAFTGGLSAIDFALKYENLKYTHLMACEIDKYARKQFLEFHGEPLEFPSDVSLACGKHLKGKVDLYCFGSPCQDLSLAGKRLGFDGQKSSLFRHGARLLEEMMPKAFIFENVIGLLSSNGGNDYKEVEKTFRDMGYHILLGRINAKEQGTAQNRDRVFIVGFLDVEDYHKFSFADSVPLTKCLRDYLDDEVDEKYYLSQKMIDGFIKKDNNFQGSFSVKDVDNAIANCLDTKEGNRRTNNFVKSKMKIQAFHNKDDSHCATLTARYFKCGITDPYIKEPIKIKSATKSGYEIATENDSINFTHLKSTTRRGRVGKGVAQTLDCACNQAVIEPKIYQTGRGYNKGGEKDICPTITINSWERNNHLIDKFRIRRLTPRECFRLMGMKDEDIELVNSDTQSYKIAGNGIEINTMRSIVRQLYKHVSKKDTLF